MVEPWAQVGDDIEVYDGWTRVLRRTYRRPDGRASVWDLVSCADSVAVLALTKDNRVVCVRQYRPGPGAVLTALPGGLLDTGESVSDAARRELREETGYAADWIEVVAHTTPYKSTERRWAAIAHGCTLVGEQTLDSEEDVDVVVLDHAEVRALLRTGEFGTTDQAYLALDHLRLL